MAQLTSQPARAAQRPTLYLRHLIENVSGLTFGLLSFFPLALTIFMIVALAVRARPITEGSTLGELLLGRTWLPLEGQFGYFPFIAGTLWVTVLAMLIAVPPALLTTIYLAEYANRAGTGGG